MLKRYQASRCLILSISCLWQLTFCEPLACVADKQRINSGQTKDKTIFGQKRKAQKQRKSSVSELFDLVTRTGIEPMIPPWKGSVLTSWPTGHIIAAVGFEPTTNRVWTEYSSQLSYAAILDVVCRFAFPTSDYFIIHCPALNVNAFFRFFSEKFMFVNL